MFSRYAFDCVLTNGCHTALESDEALVTVKVADVSLTDEEDSWEDQDNAQTFLRNLQQKNCSPDRYSQS